MKKRLKTLIFTVSFASILAVSFLSVSCVSEEGGKNSVQSQPDKTFTASTANFASPGNQTLPVPTQIAQTQASSPMAVIPSLDLATPTPAATSNPTPEATPTTEVTSINEVTPAPIPVVTFEASPSVTETATPAASLTPTPPPGVSAPTRPPNLNEKAVTVSSSITKKTVSMPENIKDPYYSSYGKATDENGILTNKKLSWYFGKNPTHQPPTAQKEFDIRKFNGYYLGDITNKKVYLTFDEGYENGYTSKILDILKEKQVTAAFFVTKPYIKENTKLVKRMVDEGHIVANHSVKHKSCPSLSNEEMKYEIEETARYYKEVTGLDMPLFFRPPMGEYSARTLDITNSLGYKTIFWSFAYKDWVVEDQPGAAAAYKAVLDNLHNGEIMLLHAVSLSNTEALPDIIDSTKASGFEFKSLYELDGYDILKKTN